MKALLLATANAGKQREIAGLLGDGFRVATLADFNIDSPEESGLSFVENALIKARHACRESGLPALGDDSGLCVDALAGGPGLYSARYAGEAASDRDNWQKLLHAMNGEADRRAHFICVLASLEHPEDPDPVIAIGRWHGQILHEARGDGGFGYDPVFQPTGHTVSAAELAADAKRRLSHRGMALAAWLDAVRERGWV